MRLRLRLRLRGGGARMTKKKGLQLQPLNTYFGVVTNIVTKAGHPFLRRCFLRFDSFRLLRSNECRDAATRSTGAFPKSHARFRDSNQQRVPYHSARDNGPGLDIALPRHPSS